MLFTLGLTALVAIGMGFVCDRCGADLGYLPRRCSACKRGHA